jgi:hypothetical protein
MEAVDILCRRDVGIDCVVREGRREGGLNENAVDEGIGVERVDFMEKGGQGGGGGKNESATGDADFFGACFFAGNVGAGGGVFPNANKDKFRGDASFVEGGDANCSFAVNRTGKSFSIEDVCRHGKRLQRRRVKWN